MASEAINVTLNDAVFGEMTFDGERRTWQGRGYVSIVHAVVTLDIDADDTGPTGRQRASYATFQQASASLFPKLQQELHQFYLGIRNMLLNSMPGEPMFFERDMPAVDTAQQVWDMITPKELMILDESYNGDGKLMVIWECPWDIEHGLSATFQNGELIEVESP